MFRAMLAVSVFAIAGVVGAQTAIGHPADGQRDPWYAYAVSYSNPSFVTDTLAPGGTSAPVQGYAFITDTLAPGGGTSFAPVPAARGFDWGDAGIGAAGSAGIAFVLLGSIRVVASRRRVVAA